MTSLQWYCYNNLILFLEVLRQLVCALLCIALLCVMPLVALRGCSWVSKSTERVVHAVVSYPHLKKKRQIKTDSVIQSEAVAVGSLVIHGHSVIRPETVGVCDFHSLLWLWMSQYGYCCVLMSIANVYFMFVISLL